MQEALRPWTLIEFLVATGGLCVLCVNSFIDFSHNLCDNMFISIPILWSLEETTTAGGWWACLLKHVGLWGLMAHDPLPFSMESLQVTWSTGHRLCPSSCSRIGMRRRPCSLRTQGSGLPFRKDALPPSERQGVHVDLTVLGAHFQRYFSRWTHPGLGPPTFY